MRRWFSLNKYFPETLIKFIFKSLHNQLLRMSSHRIRFLYFTDCIFIRIWIIFTNLRRVSSLWFLRCYRGVFGLLLNTFFKNWWRLSVYFWLGFYWLVDLFFTWWLADGVCFVMFWFVLNGLSAKRLWFIGFFVI